MPTESPPTSVARDHSTASASASAWTWLARIGLGKVDRYVLKEVIGPFFGGIVFFVFVFLMFQALRLAEIFIVHGVSGWVLLKMILLLTLSFLPMALPVAFLVGVLVGFGRLSADSELVALKASGFGISRLAAPVGGFSIAVVALSIALNLQWVPWGERAFKNLLIKVSNTKVVSSLKEGTFTSGFFDLLIFAEKVDPKTNRLRKVFIYDEREPKSPLAVVAQSGELVAVKTEKELASSAVLKLYNGSIHRSDSSEQTYQKIEFEQYRLWLNVDEGSPNASLKPSMIPYRKLRETIAKAPALSLEKRELLGELWRRIAIAVTPPLFVLLGIGFGTVRTRAVRASAALVAFVALLVYWSLLIFGSNAIYRGLLPPFAAMFLPNLVIFLAGIISFRRSAW